ncbi:YrzE family protein [Aporhodopirellula aestuarii]|uniref:YrzE family protein n=1 Tax=Aporhodopirellula aestuarii TaxID=2950107 RepID=A0ABT0U7J4_9BACT|nr:YrzE family protein [Aporhodopirellula aestuarii]MCM2372326.1 YrzE family protein [Aporhodopirellula aestuarii]
MSDTKDGGFELHHSQRTEERPYSLNRGCEGCLAAWIVMFALMMFVAFVLGKMLGWIDVEGQQTLGYLNWLIGIAVGGYVAGRRGKTTGWSNSLLVGIFAQIMIVAQIIDPKDMFAGLHELLADPSDSWPKLTAIILTIPAALAGGLIWSQSQESEGSQGSEGGQE